MLALNVGKSTIADTVLANCGLTKEQYFNPNRNPYIVNLEETAEMIKEVVNQGKTIKIIGDYDADGVGATAIMLKTLTSLGAKVKVRIPYRISEGFGINMSILNEVKEDVIITVDNGIAALDVIDEAKKLGKIVIVIDHHEPVIMNGQIILPNADIILDPKAIKGSEFCEYCGAGLAYKVAQKLIPNNLNLLNELVSIAAISTVGDVVSVLHDNRNIIRDGIDNINKGIMPIGLAILLNRLNISFVDEVTFGYKICPIINAIGRLYDTKSVEGVKLLSLKNEEKLNEIATRLIEVNEERKALVKIYMDKAEEVIKNDCLYSDCIMVIKINDCPEGIVGIIAGHICEKYNVPAIVFTETLLKGQKVFKASARSIKGISIKEILDKCRDYIIKYGGHEGAAGLSVSIDKYKDFCTHVLEVCSEYVVKKNDKTCDMEISEEEIPLFTNELRKYKPFGMGNPPLKVIVNEFTLSPSFGQMFCTLGENNETIKLFGKTSCAIGFGLADKYIEKLNKPIRVNLLGEVTENHYMGKTTSQIIIDDLEAVEIQKLESSLQKALRNRMTLL